MIKKHKSLLFLMIGFALFYGTEAVRSYFVEEEREIRTQIREKALEAYPKVAQDIMANYGIEPYGHKTALAENQNGKHVILIHGIDDPKKAWMNLAPALEKAGYSVGIMTYPNDQPIRNSAQFFIDQLLELKAKNISIIAHSMGGLVSREMLTAPDMAYADKVQKGLVPKVDHLIMVGTPNHGSELARFRIITELREQFIHMTKSNYHWMQFFVDGAGEAGLDLIPDSPFLAKLNARPHPDGVDMMVIAGLMSPKDKVNLDAFVKRFGVELPKGIQTITHKVEEKLDTVTGAIGDGAVTAQSARLGSVPYKTVSGTHLSIIRNMFPGSTRVPPAVPLILDKLSQKSE